MNQVTVGAIQTRYIYDLAGQVVADVNASNTWIAGYVYLNGRLVAQYSSNTTLFALSDHLGSTRGLTQMNGTVLQSYDYQPFGELIAGGSSTTHKFTGKERDGESGLDHYLYRHLAPSTGRWTTPDPAMCSTTDPQKLNRYSYVENDPTNRTDALGLYSSGASGWDCFNAWVGGRCNTGGGPGPGQLLDGTGGGFTNTGGGWHDPWIDNCRFLGTPVYDFFSGDIVACRISPLPGGGGFGWGAGGAASCRVTCVRILLTAPIYVCGDHGWGDLACECPGGRGTFVIEDTSICNIPGCNPCILCYPECSVLTSRGRGV